MHEREKNSLIATRFNIPLSVSLNAACQGTQNKGMR